ncbi:Retrotransposable element Tf2 protein [Rhizoctonia solani]|uniref:Retrotransposable element Tf2 protein n=1 Tax=Rhizoctonia solani TaxID=456999 RepID=A0A8H8P913_9AGAM|nr:Retrotransposable element Tf2 protein [Rhizoctonia solani]QRW27796.1 Retrotransposable element Tf2 protein [Rhizoctonia solani]
MDLEPSPQVMIPESHFEAFSAHIDLSLLDQIKEATQEDPSLDTILLAVSDPKSMPHSIAQKFKDYTIQKGLLLYQGRVVVPDEPEIKQQLLSHFHDSPASGHQGRAQTLESKGHAHNYALNLLSVPAGPWEDISYDFIIKFPKCKGYDSILVVVDHFSKMMHLVPCKETATAEDVAQMFLEHLLKALYKSLQITPSFSTAYHPQSDGQTEIKNQWLEAYLRPFINHRQSDWVDWLPLAEFAHNNARSKATGKLPFEIVYGCSPGISTLLEPTGLPIADDRAKQLAETIQAVQASIKWAQERYKQADTGKPPPEFQPGGKVWLLASNITLQRPNKKLDHKQYGPFPVIERIGFHAYCLALPETMKIHDVFHVSLLSAFKQDTEFDCTFTPLPPVITAEGEEEYKVDKFVDWAAEDRIWKYRVRWKGYAPHEDTQEPAKDLQHCKDKLRNFFANYPDAPAANNAICYGYDISSIIYFAYVMEAEDAEGFFGCLKECQPCDMAMGYTNLKAFTAYFYRDRDALPQGVCEPKALKKATVNLPLGVQE